MSTPSYDDIRQQVERHYRRLSYFIFHIIMAVTSVIIIWLIDPTPQDGTPVIAGLWFLEVVEDESIEGEQRFEEFKMKR